MSQRDAWKKLVEDASNFASFYSSQIDGIFCVKQIGVGKDIREILKLYKNELRL